MSITIALFVFTIFLAYANGANDNFKGVATLFGSNTTNYKVALGWATVTTIAGSLSSIVVAHKLIEAFSGKGLVPPVVAQEPTFLLAVAVGAGLTVMIATLTGFPISTTHSLVGALIGAGLSTVVGEVNFAALSGGFVAPLLFSPFIAVILAAIAYRIFRKGRLALGITKEDCLCVGEDECEEAVASTALSSSATSITTMPLPNGANISAKFAKNEVCQERYQGAVMGIGAEKLLDVMHFISAGAVSFARGLNDTPKIMGLILVAGAFDIQYSMLMIAFAMAIGGVLNAKKVAHVMSRDITYMNHGQGFTANIVTAGLVIVASKFGMPVSTTHVSVGSLFGIGAVTKNADYGTIKKIVASWILTLPIAATIAAVVYLSVHALQ